MKLYRFLLALPLAVFFTGCMAVDSLNPLYTPQDVVFDQSLLGQWGAESDGLNFAKLGDNGYRVVMSGKNEDTGQITTAVFDAHLVALQGHRFLDIVWRQTPGFFEDGNTSAVHVTRTSQGKLQPRFIKSDFGAFLELLPDESGGPGDRFRIRRREAHQFFKVVMEDEGQTLKLIQLDDSWINHQIESGNLVIDHENAEGAPIVLTATTPELQKLVLDHVNDEEAFKGETVVHREATTPQ